MKYLKNDKIFKIFSSITLMAALILGTMGNQYTTKTAKNNITQKSKQAEKITPSVAYNGHIQDLGWEEDFSKKDGEISGTTGKCLRVEALKIKLKNLDDASIKYEAHVQDIGWQGWKKDGEIAGTQGKCYRVEAIKIKLENAEKYSISYRTHVEDIGWQDWKTDGEIAGTTGQCKRIEAIQIKIINKVEKSKLNVETTIPDICYNDTKTIDVSGWKMANVEGTKIKATLDDKEITNISYVKRDDVIKNEQGYGTIKENPEPGFKFQIDTSAITEGKHTLKIELISNDGKTLQTYSKNIQIDRQIHLKYQAHVQDIGWQDWKKDEEIAGTQGRNLRVEAIKIDGINIPEGVKIKYQAHVEDIGWQGWKNAGEIAGTQGKCLRVEGIKIKLEGTEDYSVMYSTHVQDIGWQDWCYDGEASGTVGECKKIEAIKIKLVPKIKSSKNSMYIDSPVNQIPNTIGKLKGWTMTTNSNTKLQVFIDDTELDTSNIKRTKRQDVLNAMKGYGDENINNQNPGFEMDIDYSKYSIGNHTVLVKLLDENNETLITNQAKFTIRNEIKYSKGVYGITGLKAVGNSNGSNLEYYKWGNGPNVFYATFAIHGFEDLWWRDGSELVQIANDFYNKLINSNDYDLSDKWTIYIFPGVNQDGLNHGNTNNGPGRTTLVSQAPGGQGIDLNRCWQVGDSYTRRTDSRNYNGTQGFQAYEAQYLRDFLIQNRAKNGQTLLVDLHGWTQQLIGDSTMCSFYRNEFPENNGSAIGRYGDGYLVNWARNSLGANGRAAKAALIELPHSGVYNHQSVLNQRFSQRYINATLSMLRNM